MQVKFAWGVAKHWVVQSKGRQYILWQVYIIEHTTNEAVKQLSLPQNLLKKIVDNDFLYKLSK